MDKHAHLYCLECETIIDLKEDIFQSLEQSFEQQSGNKILSHQLLLTGICKECRKKERK